MQKLIAALLVVVSIGWSGLAMAGEVKVAVAGNFTAAAKQIAASFQSGTGHRVKLSFGSTGKLFAQIAYGAPFAVFLAADEARPRKCESEGLAVVGSRFTYAIGKLVLYSANPKLVDAEGSILASPDKFKRLALANPKTAPYGAAAVQTMTKQGVLASLRSKLVRGDNVLQAFQFIKTGNAELGFAALAQIAADDKGSKWIVPEDLYTPIRQDAVLLKRGQGDEVAKAFYAFLRSDKAKAIIRTFGYGVE